MRQEAIFGTDETTFQYCFKKSSTKWGRWDSASSWANIQITFNKFFYSRKQLLMQMPSVVFFANFDTIIIYKKTFGYTIPWNRSGYYDFLDILFVDLSKFSSRISDFFPLPYTRSFRRLTGVTSFSSCQTVFFDHTHVTFKSFSKGASAGSSSVSSHFTHFCCGFFKRLNCLRFLFFYYSPKWWPTDSCLFGDFSWC